MYSKKAKEGSFQSTVTKTIKKYPYLFDPRVVENAGVQIAKEPQITPNQEFITYQEPVSGISRSDEGLYLETHEITLPTTAELNHFDTKDGESWEHEWEYEWNEKGLDDNVEMISPGFWDDIAREDNGIIMRDGTVLEETELLAVYRSFHFYKDWGVLFFEAPMESYAKRIYHDFQSLRIRRRPKWCLKAAFYIVARHEFFHYLTDLTAFQYEVNLRRPIYIPYKEIIKPKLKKKDQQIEETVATYWKLENPVSRNGVNYEVFKSITEGHITNSYSKGAKIDELKRKALEDKIIAQMLQCTSDPTDVPEVWGALPRPYFQPWTRYDEIDWRITKSSGGIIADRVNKDPLRKTIYIEP